MDTMKQQKPPTFKSQDNLKAVLTGENSSPEISNIKGKGKLIETDDPMKGPTKIQLYQTLKVFKPPQSQG